MRFVQMQIRVVVYVVCMAMVARLTCAVDCSPVEINSNTDIPGLASCTIMGDLKITGSVTDLTGMPASFTVTDFWLDGAVNLTSLAGLEGMTNAGTLYGISLWDSPLLSDISALSGLTAAGILEVHNCHSLTSLDGLQNLASTSGGSKVTQLTLLNNAELADISQLSGIEYFEFLKLTDMPKLTTLDGLQSLSTAGVTAFAANFIGHRLHALVNISMVPFETFASSAVGKIELYDLPEIRDDGIARVFQATVQTVIVSATPRVRTYHFQSGVAINGGSMDVCTTTPSTFFGSGVTYGTLPDIACPSLNFRPIAGFPAGSNLADVGALATLVNMSLTADGVQFNLTFPPTFTVVPSKLRLSAAPGFDATDAGAPPISSSHAVSVWNSTTVSIVFTAATGAMPSLFLRDGIQLDGVYTPIDPGTYDPIEFSVLSPAGEVLGSSMSGNVAVVARPSPVITSINGAASYSGRFTGGDVISIGGLNFGWLVDDIANVTIGNMTCAPVVSVTPTQIECVSPGGGPMLASHDVLVFTRSSGLAPPSTSASFAFLAAPPVVSGIGAPGVTRGTLAFAGGDVVSLFGTNLGTAAGDVVSISLGSSTCTLAAWISSTHITCTTGPFDLADFAVGGVPVAVTVVTLSSGSVASLVSGTLTLELSSPPPVVTTLNDRGIVVGGLQGGEALAIAGTGLGLTGADLAAVWVVDVACEDITWVSSELITCTSPVSSRVKRGPVVVQTYSSGPSNSTSPAGVEFVYQREVQSLEEPITFAVAAGSSFALAFYWLIIMIVLGALFSLYKRHKNKKKQLEWARFRRVSFIEKLFTDHSVLGIPYYDRAHPFTRISRVLTLILEVLINFLSVILVTVVAPAVYSDSEASNKFRRETNTSGDWLLSLAMGTTLSVIVGKPIIQHVLENASVTSSRGVLHLSRRSLAQLVTCGINLLLLAVNVVLCIDPSLIIPSSAVSSIDTAQLIARFVANMLLSWVVTEPLLVLLKMKVWLDTVIRTSKYEVNHTDAKASNVVKMGGYFTDRMASDGSDVSSADVVSVAVTRASGPGTRSSTTTTTKNPTFESESSSTSSLDSHGSRSSSVLKSTTASRVARAGSSQLSSSDTSDISDVRIVADTEDPMNIAPSPLARTSSRKKRRVRRRATVSDSTRLNHEGSPPSTVRRSPSSIRRSPSAAHRSPMAAQGRAQSMRVVASHSVASSPARSSRSPPGGVRSSRSPPGGVRSSRSPPGGVRSSRSPKSPSRQRSLRKSSTRRSGSGSRNNISSINTNDILQSSSPELSTPPPVRNRSVSRTTRSPRSTARMDSNTSSAKPSPSPRIANSPAQRLSQQRPARRPSQRPSPRPLRPRAASSFEDPDSSADTRK